MSVAEEKSFPQSSNVKDRGENSQKSIDSGYSPRSSAAKDGGPKEFLSQHSCGCLMYFIIWIICLVYLFSCSIPAWLAWCLSFSGPVLIFLIKLHRSGEILGEKFPVGCLMYFIIWIIALVFLMYCTNSFGLVFLLSLAVPVGVFIGLCQSSGDEG